MAFYIFIGFIYFTSMFLIISIHDKATKSKTPRPPRAITQSGEPVFIEEQRPATVNPKDVDKIVHDYLALNLKLEPNFIDSLYNLQNTSQVLSAIDNKIKERA